MLLLQVASLMDEVDTNSRNKQDLLNMVGMLEEDQTIKTQTLYLETRCKRNRCHCFGPFLTGFSRVSHGFLSAMIPHKTRRVICSSLVPHADWMLLGC